MKILVLSTWFPYPLNQGSKIRAYHLIKALAAQHQLALIAFEDAPVHPAWLAHIGQLCQEVTVVPRQPFAHDRLKSWLGWFSWQPRAVVAGYSPEMAACVRRVAARWSPEAVFALTFVTAPYALKVGALPRVLDVDILLARMLSESYQRAEGVWQRVRRFVAYWKFQQYERWLFKQFDLCLVTSAQDCQRLAQDIPLSPAQVRLVPNGVDLDHHQPTLEAPEANSLVFNGALTYRANYDAMDYFLKQIFPLIRSARPEARLRITGATHNVNLGPLLVDDHVTFTGYVDDIRPVVSQSAVCVVPLREGAGTRLKILEAMALGTPVVSTTKGAEGLEVEPGRHLLIADDPIEFAAQTLRLLHDRQLCKTLAAQAACLVRERYDWAQIRGELGQLMHSLRPASAYDR